MKFNIEVDCTPEEVRRLVGLPDLTEVHEVYLGRIKDLMRDGLTPAVVEQMLKSWSPMGDGAMKLWQGLFDGMTRGGGTKGG